MYYDTDVKLPPQRWTHLPDMCEPQTSAPRRWGWRGRRASAPWSTVLCLDEWAWRSSVGETSTHVTAVRARANLRRSAVGNFSETYGQGVHVDDHEMKGHGEGHGTHQPAVAPGGHAQQRLVLRQAGGGHVRLKLGRFWNENVRKWWTLL